MKIDDGEDAFDNWDENPFETARQGCIKFPPNQAKTPRPKLVKVKEWGINSIL